MKRKLINSFIILSISSTLAKIFSILNRIILSRQLSSEAMALYILVMPTVSLCITDLFQIRSQTFDRFCGLRLDWKCQLRRKTYCAQNPKCIL